MDAQDQKKLFRLAMEAKETSYSPYSKFRVGAALLTKDGTFFKGCNVENSSYGGAICAERTAYVKAVSEGHRQFRALAVSTDQEDFVSPCGICRQFISEFSNAEMPIYFLNNKGEHREFTMGQLLPLAFNLENHIERNHEKS
ncbi:cytidine deaminase [Mycotypha africana]|uniref:cytidine deaminase n=1 Tax=Mycotypha africana TaxID=64632 RepID=UPI0023005BE5|nr:cytidine deaminase [Mycotypha africana]KAI8988210.1 cytidine deaminase [Mycotypha africana]